VQVDRWGFEGGSTYWEGCMFQRDAIGQRDCSTSPRIVYSVHAFDGREFRYTSTASGRSYLMRLVPRDFVFPR
jgi:hypothetical protein